MSQDYRSRFQQVVDGALGGATVLTDNTRSARCVLAACERNLLSQGKKIWATPAVLPLMSWLQQTWREAQARGAVEKALLRPAQELQLWEQIIERAGGTEDLLRPNGLSPEALQAWRLLHEYRISRRSSAFAATRQTREFLGWCKAFESVCAERGFIDNALLVDEVATLLRREPQIAPRRVIVWGFDQFTPQQRALFAALRETGAECEVIESDFAPSSAVRVELSDAEQEIVFAARWARAQLESAPSKRIGIVIPGLAGLRSTVERVFLRELNPEFFGGVESTRAFDISLGLPLASYAVIRTALLALRLASDTLPFPELRELLTSVYLSGAEREGSARAVIVAKLSEQMPEQVSLATLIEKMSASKLRDVECPQLRAALRNFSAKSALPARARFGEWARIIHALLEAIGWPGESGARKLKSDEYQAIEKWREVLSEVASLELVSGACNWPTTLSTLAARVQSTVFAPENRAAAVQILGEAEAAGSVFDAVWVCGLTDEAWPPRRRANPLIPLTLQREAGVFTSSPESATALARTILDRMLASAEEVVVSFPNSDGDREQRPSSLILHIPATMAEDLKLSAASPWEQLQTAECESLDDSTAPAIAPEDLMHHGTSVIEKQSNCPFRAFGELRLLAKKIEDPPAGIRATERGKIIERALELVWESLRDQHTLNNTAESELAAIVQSSVDRAIEDELPETGDPLRLRLKAIERERLVRLVLEWLELERNRDNFEVIVHQREVKFTLGGISMRGVIDRIDRVGEGFVVLDYKAGENYKASHWRVPRPQRPQLPIYAVALNMTEGWEIAGLSFAKVLTGKCDLAGAAVRPEILGKQRSSLNRLTERRSLPQQIGVWRAEFEKLAADHLAGRAAVDPKIPPTKSSSSCDYCPLNALCRVAELELISDEEGGDDEQQ